MTPDSNRSEESDPVETNPTETLALEHPDEIQFGITRGESDLEIGPLREDPDQMDVSVRTGDELVLFFREVAVAEVANSDTPEPRRGPHNIPVPVVRRVHWFCHVIGSNSTSDVSKFRLCGYTLVRTISPRTDSKILSRKCGPEIAAGVDGLTPLKRSSACFRSIQRHHISSDIE